jgi:hypothetical protein
MKNIYMNFPVVRARRIQPFSRHKKTAQPALRRSSLPLQTP